MNAIRSTNLLALLRALDRLRPGESEDAVFATPDQTRRPLTGCNPGIGAPHIQLVWVSTG